MTDRPRNPEEVVEQAVNEIEEQEELTEINEGDDDLTTDNEPEMIEADAEEESDAE